MSPTLKQDSRRNDARLLPSVKVETLANGGAGLARHQGRVIFIPHTAAGDMVSCRVIKEKKHYLEAQLVEIIEPSDVRTRPVCPVAGECGGCHWQHLPYPEQLMWKDKLFRDTLAHQCNSDPDRVRPIVASADPWNYRSRVQIKCHNTSQGFVTGFYRPQSHFVVSIDQCPIIADKLNILLADVRHVIDKSDFSGHVPQLDLAIDDQQKCTLTVHYLGKKQDLLIKYLLAAKLDADLVIQSGFKRNRRVIKGDGILQIHVSEPGLQLQYAVGSFAQVNLDQNRKLVEYVLQLATLAECDEVIDLYCGMGNFSLPLAQSCRQVTGVEESPVSVKFARLNAENSGIDNCTFICASAVTAFREICQAKIFDLLLLDPPRQGAYDLMREILNNPVRKIIYVSCDPQTLARDLKLLVHNGYKLISSQPFDMFPQTYHCESVTFLERQSNL